MEMSVESKRQTHPRGPVLQPIRQLDSRFWVYCSRRATVEYTEDYCDYCATATAGYFPRHLGDNSIVTSQRRQITTSRHFIRAEYSRIRRRDGHPPLVNASFVIDGMKIVVLGGAIETARRVSSSACKHFVNSFFLTVHFSEEDHPYGWLALGLSRRCVHVLPFHLLPTPFARTPLSAFPFRFANTRAVLPYHPPARRFAWCFPDNFSPPFAFPYTFPRHPTLSRPNFPPPSQLSAPSFPRALPAPAASHWPPSPRVPPCAHPSTL
ncbi:hypothetical protein B0H16DRAFT_1894426 [Mycena metata]|uniref:Uncharacterized protein n=1 Tax=Mycena metata TaxID=1033252 RepID=A0AAD7HSN0_9AGAR|nr:hypothetical protein B0H16DRAFT_1894426 [Mycena metata]